MCSSDLSDARFHLKPGEVRIESIAHACFRIHSAGGSRILIDPHASRVWLGYDFPEELATDAILITHPTTITTAASSSAGRCRGRRKSGCCATREATQWATSTLQVSVGSTPIGGASEFGQKNNGLAVEVSELRIAHSGDNGPLTESNVRELGGVDILMMPIDAREHILKRDEIQAIRRAARPRVLIPMHYRHPDLESSEDSPHGLGPIDPWLAGKKSVTRLKSNYALFTTGSLKSGERIVVFQHSPKVRAKV